jgi:hypothetical protein
MSYNRSNKQPIFYRVIGDINWCIHRCGFFDGFVAGLMVSVFSALMGLYLAWGLA